ncbi:hypothetical protein ACFV4G_40505 [Kitasatospora sp. NPDC059747]|uniref:hypothetical protein n=1 Tax=Kitasatospora sp. NPDC059747 TaxID=3346930 RepID=UPI003665CDCA
MTAATARYVVAVRLTRAPPIDRLPDPATVVDLFWAHAAPADRLDHVRTSAPAPAGRLDIAVILRAESAEDCLRTVRNLCARTTRSPTLSGWTAERLSTLPLAGLGF